ncbi:MAG: sigma-E factor negative regulatory protein [Proteobacteria bacterium]|nr:sigma-E factor negative regulatory protein [Pseudomonadota bacterium]
MNEELDSQLSAMFDDELPHEECELLARRLSRDEGLKARWGRYAVVGAVIRAERGVRLNAPLAGRVSAAIRTEPELERAVPAVAARARLGWWQPALGGALAAGVAAVSILWLRGQVPLTTVPVTAQRAPQALGNDPNPYVTPRLVAAHSSPVPSTQLANYVVAHSMVSSPMARGNLLSAFITSESSAPEPVKTDLAGNAK